MEKREEFVDARRASWRRIAMAVVPAVLCAVLLGQVLVSGRRLSQTADEATHLFAGYRYLKCGDLTVSPEHPPLAKSIAAAPLLSMHLPVDCSAFSGTDSDQAVAALSWFYSNDYRAVLNRARTAISIFAVALCLLVWIAARRMFGFATAVVATVLLIFEPNVLANAALVMTDVAVTAMMLFAVFGFYLWAGRRTPRYLLLTALATGLALLAKNSGVVILPILGVLAVAEAFVPGEHERSPWQRVQRNLLAVGAICVLALAVVWVGYGMRYSAPGLEMAQPGQLRPTISAHLLRAIAESHALPQAYLQGLAGAFTITDFSAPVFLLGKVYPERPWFAIPILMLIRCTAASLAMMVLAGVGLGRVFRQRRRELLFVLAPLAVYLAVCLHSNCEINVRYLLPMFPFLLIAVAAGCVEAARRVRWLSCAVGCLIVLHAASSLHAFPNYLSYANELWGGPAKASQYLPWVDIGQAYPEAKVYMEKHPGEPCWLLTSWQWDAAFYDLPCQSIGYYFVQQIPVRLKGTVIVSSTMLRSVQPDRAEAVTSFQNATPMAYLGGSALLVYRGEMDMRGAAGMISWRLAERARKAGKTDLALKYSNQAVAMDPASYLTHVELCGVLVSKNDFEAALGECEQARVIAARLPILPPEFGMMEQNLQYLRGEVQRRRSSRPQ